MSYPPNIVALIVAAGQGTRIGGRLPKQFAPVGGKAMVAHSVDAFALHRGITATYVVIGKDQHEMLAVALGTRVVAAVISGGEQRHQSVRAGLSAIGKADSVLIHDAARPFLPAAVIDRLIAALASADGVVPVLPVVDTLAVQGKYLGEAVDRSVLVRIQTPQAFRFDAIVAAHDAWQGGAATDDAQIARAAGINVGTVSGDSMLEKITHPHDFSLAEARVAGSVAHRTGLGYDVHRLVDGTPLWLCGVRIDHTQGLSGHSDADVALHAVTDALLGAIGAGDIGDHFPPTDPQWRGASSSIFIEHAAQLVAARGAKINSIDVTIICEAPRIGPHRAAMRERIAGLLNVNVDIVSVKATTTEGLGFAGRGEGIAAQAIATVRQMTYE